MVLVFKVRLWKLIKKNGEYIKNVRVEGDYLRFDMDGRTYRADMVNGKGVSWSFYSINWEIAELRRKKRELETLRLEADKIDEKGAEEARRFLRWF